MDQKVKRSNLLIPSIAESYRSEYTEYSRRGLRCSDAGAAADGGQKCEREIYYDFTAPELKTALTNGTLVLFDDGRLHESDIRRRLRLVLRSPEKEVMDESTGARGKIDNMIALRSLTVDKTELPNLEDPIFEIKSTNEYSFQSMAETGVIDQNYYDQVQEYMLNTGIKWTIVLIKNRNSSGADKGELPFLEFIIESDPERQSQIRAGLLTVRECFNQKILPPRPFQRNSTKCSYCRFKRTCWPEEAAGIPVTPAAEEAPIVAPSEEILNGAMILASKLQAEIAEKEAQLKEAKSIVSRYFKATKAEDLVVGNVKAIYFATKRTTLDEEYLKETLSASDLLSISDPSRKKLEKAIEDRRIDAMVLDAATKVTGESYTLKISSQKVKDVERKTTPDINKLKKESKKAKKKEKIQ